MLAPVGRGFFQRSLGHRRSVLLGKPPHKSSQQLTTALRIALDLPHRSFQVAIGRQFPLQHLGVHQHAGKHVGELVQRVGALRTATALRGVRGHQRVPLAAAGGGYRLPLPATSPWDQYLALLLHPALLRQPAPRSRHRTQSIAFADGCVVRALRCSLFWACADVRFALIFLHSLPVAFLPCARQLSKEHATHQTLSRRTNGDLQGVIAIRARFAVAGDPGRSSKMGPRSYCDYGKAS